MKQSQILLDKAKQQIVSLDQELSLALENEFFPNKNSKIAQGSQKKKKFRTIFNEKRYNAAAETFDIDDWSPFHLSSALLAKLNQLGFSSPTLIQKLVLNETLTDGTWSKVPDLVCTSPTGSGKTLAFLLPLINVLDTIGPFDTNSLAPITVLVLAPTRELAFQINAVALDFLKDSKIRVGLLTGGISLEKQRRLLSKQGLFIVRFNYIVDILICTPGRLAAFVTENECNFQERISQISYLVIDEIDRMVKGDGHFKELGSIFSMVQPKATMVFSATIDNHDVIKDFDKIPFNGRPIYLNSSSVHEPPPNIASFMIRCTSFEKEATLVALLEEEPNAPTIIFVNSISMIRRLTSLLCLLDIVLLPLHSKMEQRQRLKNIDRIRIDPKYRVLLATDAAGRGIDLPHVSRVIHYQLPLTQEQFIHRSGRTGRGARTGTSFLLVAPEDQSILPSLFPQTPPRPNEALESKIWSPECINPIKERLRLAYLIDSYDHEKRKSKFSIVDKTVNEETLVEAQMAKSKISKLRSLLSKLNLRK